MGATTKPWAPLLAEALGMSLPGSAAIPAPYRERPQVAYQTGLRIVDMVREDLKPSKILTREAFENAITVVMALGGSTNAVLHLLAIAREAEVELSLHDFNRIGDKVPHVADMKPFGKYVMNDVDRHGGIPVIMKAMLDEGLLPFDGVVGGTEMLRGQAAGLEGVVDALAIERIDTRGGVTDEHPVRSGDTRDRTTHR